MVEYVIELVEADKVVGIVHIERNGDVHQLIPTYAAYQHCSKFRVKDRALKFAAKYKNARLASTFGGFCSGSKSTVSPKQSQINRSSPYRSI